MATNRPGTPDLALTWLSLLDLALTWLSLLDMKVEFRLADLEGRTIILKIHTSISGEKNIRYELLAWLCPDSTGAEIKSVCMFAIRAGRKMSLTDFSTLILIAVIAMVVT